ncbi:hypothetical protein [Roseateles terrae]|uniref:Uncharacterized protein n=1 Tax=Roseateles terrae TaxID=431060 RepID=A0ABR6GNF6_9BURK|nr:hypothetical protein [Roseateles terrae]MBB3193650.1 hypothetical protein [Roseateles terrae]OWQ89189.1 hypothetical protein CDN98_01145 [Roseateles terrae]
MRRADVSVHVEQRRMPCVLEPSLLLTHAQGPSLALRLVSVVEPWLTRSFWQALDNSELLTGRLPRLGSAAPISAAALTRWIQLRERTDESAWVLRWVGDRIAESQLRDVEDLSLFDQFELLQAALEVRAEHKGMTLRSPWPGLDLRRAALDALSLSAVLEGALVLCAASAGQAPSLVLLAEQLGFEVIEVVDLLGGDRLADGGSVRPASSVSTTSPTSSLFSTERGLLREALARAGLATLAQQLPPLAVLHVVRMEDADVLSDPSSTDAIDEPLALDAAGDCPPPDPWDGTRVWWYWL